MSPHSEPRSGFRSILLIALVVVAGGAAFALRERAMRHRIDAAAREARDARHDAELERARAEAALRQARQLLVDDWSGRGTRHWQHADNGLAMLSFARALELAGDDAPLARIPRLQLTALSHTTRVPRRLPYAAPYTVFNPHEAAFVDGGRALLTTSRGWVVIWDVATGRQIAKLRPTGPATRPATTATTTATTAAASAPAQNLVIHGACLSPDASRLAMVGGYGDRANAAPRGWITLYEFPSLRPLQSRALAFLPLHVTFGTRGGGHLLVESAGRFEMLDASLEPVPTQAEPWATPTRITPDGLTCILSKTPFSNMMGMPSQWRENDVIRLPETSRSAIPPALGTTSLLQPPAGTGRIRLSTSGDAVLYALGSDLQYAALKRGAPDASFYSQKFDDYIQDFDWSEETHHIAVLLRDDTLHVFDTNLRVGDRPFEVLSLHAPAARLVRLSPDGRTVATVADWGLVSLWDLWGPTHFSPDDAVPPRAGVPAAAAAKPPEPAVFGTTYWSSDDGAWLIRISTDRVGRGDSTATFYPVSNFAAATTVLLPSSSLDPFISMMRPDWFERVSVSFSSDGRRFLLPGPIVGDLRQGTSYRLGGAGFHPSAAALSPDGSVAVTVAPPEGVSQWDPLTGQRSGALLGGVPPQGGWFTPGGELASPDGRWAITSDHTSNGLRVWDVRAGKQASTIQERVNDDRLLWTADGKLLRGGSTPSGVPCWHLWDPATGARLASFDNLPFTNHAGWLDPSRKFLAAAGPGRLVVFDLQRRALVGSSIPFTADQQSRVILFPDARTLLIVRRRLNDMAQQLIDAYDVATGRQIACGITGIGELSGAAFPKPDECLVTGTAGCVRLNFTPEPLTASEWMTRAKLLSLGRLDDQGMEIPLNQAERKQLWAGGAGTPATTRAAAN